MMIVTKQPLSSRRFSAVAQMLASVVSLQFGSSLAKSLFPIFGAVGVVSMRIGFAAILLAAIVRPFGRMTRDTWRLAAPYGLSMAGMNVCFYLALDRLPMGVTVAIEFIGPLLLSLSHSRRVLDIAWLALTVAGLTLLLYPHGGGKFPDPVGVLEAALSSVCWVLYIITGKRLAGRVEATIAAASGLFIGGLAMAPWFAATVVSVLSQPLWLGAGVLVAVLSSALPYTLECLVMKVLSGRDLGILYSLEPVAAACAGLLLLGEALSLQKALGIVCVVVASAGVVLNGQDDDILEPPP
ncbi:EamA family transporter [Acetobacter sacchari]|uniref:EamA family transporter n=1 Tax=Acetobacter sacchari TaxID=2661687 RepID=A0ABS3LTJ0_9PROT|nr:EamA family transporter [Acetobacter sacchari]MBO1359223.1 EamA family transporter [Acetobacter sacchari]